MGFGDRRWLWTVAVLAWLAACTPFAPADREAPEGLVPETFLLYEGPGEAVPMRWWEVFGVDELDRLVRAALAGDFSIQTAAARLRQVAAMARAEDASRLPEVSVDADAAGERRRRAGRTTRSESYSLALTAAYELDWWGRQHAERQAAHQDAAAALEDLRTAAVTVSGEVARRWIEIVAQKARRRLLEEQLATSHTYLELVRLRFSKGLASALDVYQQQQVVEQVGAAIALVAENEAHQRSALALLLGRAPGTGLEVSATDLPVLPPVPAVGLPADLLANRPDIRAAGRRLAGADWQIAAARADRLPHLTLSASAGWGAAGLDRLLEEWIMRLADGLAAPLYDGQRRQAVVQRRQAEADQALWHYRRTVYGAIQEVHDALASEAARRQHLEALERQLAAARRALEQAMMRYRKGLSDYLPVLTHLTGVQQLERDGIVRQAELLQNRVALYRALGGGWVDALAAPALAGNAAAH